MIGFVRQNGKERILAVFNFTIIPIKDYTIRCTYCRSWVEVFNTDKEEYGGGGIVCTDPAFSQPVMQHGFQQSITIGIPPLGATFWKNVEE